MSKAASALGFSRIIRYLWSEVVANIVSSCFLPVPLRPAILRLFGAKIGKDVVLHDFRIINAYNHGYCLLTIGDGAYVGQEVLIDLANEVRIGDHVSLAPRVAIYTHRNVGYPDHPLQDRFRRIDAGVEIGAGSFIGAGSILLPGLKIGTKVFVNAGITIFGRIEPDSVVKETEKPLVITSE